MRDADVAEIDVELVALGLLAGLADRHDDAAPIGVLAGEAVFTSGELAIDSAMRLAALREAAPSTLTSTNLRAPSPSRTT